MSQAKSISKSYGAYEASRFLFKYPVKATSALAWAATGASLIAAKLGLLALPKAIQWMGWALLLAVAGQLLHWFFLVLFVRTRQSQGTEHVFLPLETFSRVSWYRINSVLVVFVSVLIVTQTQTDWLSAAGAPALVACIGAALYLLADLGDGAMGALVHRMSHQGIKNALGSPETLQAELSKPVVNDHAKSTQVASEKPSSPSLFQEQETRKDWTPPQFTANDGVENILEVQSPRVNIRDHYDMSVRQKAQLVSDAMPAIHPQKYPPDKRQNGVLLYGPPGNGKTYLVECLAGLFNVPFLTLTHSKVASKWLGHEPTKIRKVFQQARAYAPCILFIDEFDSFVPDRNGPNTRHEEANQIVNQMLTEIVSIRETGVLVIAATNRLDALDPAVIRNGRFDIKLEVGNPDHSTRREVLARYIRQGGWSDQVDPDDFEFACERWNGFSMARLKAIGQSLSDVMRGKADRKIDYALLLEALRKAQGTAAKLPESTRRLSQMVLHPQTLDAIESIVSRIEAPQRVERLGGSLPTGVLFHGPAGTGKTATARALALQSGYAFVAVSGPDLLKDPKEIERVLQKAQDLRPAILFIDEADELLQERRGSNYSNLTNKLLTLMDGVEEKVKDVLFVAATNHPDLIDPAMLRAGRFTEKVPFFDAGREQVAQLILNWMQSKKAAFAEGMSIHTASEMLEGHSPANVEGALQAALNVAIPKTKGPQVQLSQDHLLRGIQTVLG